MKFVSKKQQREPKSFFGFVLMIGILVSATLIISAFQKPYEKSYSVSLPISSWIKHDRGLEIIKQQLKLSDLPSKTTTFITDSILIPLQDDIAKQVSPIYQAEQKRIQDSVSKATKPKQ